METPFHKIRALVFDMDGVFTDGINRFAIDDARAYRFYEPDFESIRLAKEAGFILGLITGSTSEFIRNTFLNAGIDFVYMGSRYKGEVFRNFLDDSGLSADETLYMGDQIPDLEPMQMAAISVSPPNACPEVLAFAYFITEKRGGQGCVKEIISRVLNTRQ